MKVDWKGLLRRFFGFLKRGWVSLPSGYNKYVLGGLMFIVGVFPVWSLVSWGSYVQAGCIIGGILFMFSDKAVGFLDASKEKSSSSKKGSDGFCSKCGTMLKTDEEFCSKCGRKRRE